MIAPQEKPTPFSREETKQISAIRKSLSKSNNPDAEILNKQLRNYARSNAEDRIALRPQIEGSIKRLEAKRAADGR